MRASIEEGRARHNEVARAPFYETSRDLLIGRVHLATLSAQAMRTIGAHAPVEVLHDALGTLGVAFNRKIPGLRNCVVPTSITQGDAGGAHVAEEGVVTRCHDAQSFHREVVFRAARPGNLRMTRGFQGEPFRPPDVGAVTLSGARAPEPFQRCLVGAFLDFEFDELERRERIATIMLMCSKTQRGIKCVASRLLVRNRGRRPC